MRMTDGEEEVIWDYKQCKHIDIIIYIKMRRYEQDVNMQDSSKISKIHFNNRLDYKRSKGKPRLRWMDDVQNELKLTVINNWKSKLVTERFGNLY